MDPRKVKEEFAQQTSLNRTELISLKILTQQRETRCDSTCPHNGNDYNSFTMSNSFFLRHVTVVALGHFNENIQMYYVNMYKYIH